MLIYNRHLLQEALYLNSTLSCFTTAKRTFVCAPCEKSDNRAPKWTPQPFRSAFICLLFALLGLFRSHLVAMCLISVSLTPSIQSVIVLFSLSGSFPLTVYTQISYNKGCYRRQNILVWVIMPSIQITYI